MEPVESEIPGKLFDGTLMRRMLKYVRPYFALMSLGVALVIPLTILANTLPQLVREAADRFLAPPAPAAALARGAADQPAGQGHSAAVPATRRPLLHVLGIHAHSLAQLGAEFLAVAFAASLLRFGQSYLLAWLGQRILFDLRADIYAKILRLPLSWFDRNPVGRLMTRVGSDVDAIQRLFTDGIIGMITDVVMLTGVMAYMFLTEHRLALIMSALFLPMLAILWILNRRVRGAHRTVRQRQAALNSYLQEMITGMTTVQLFNRERVVNERFAKHNAALRSAFLNAVKWFSYAFPATEVMNALSVALILAVGGHLLLGGDPALTVGTLLAFIIYIADFFRPLDDLSEKSNIMQSAMASAERVFALMDVEETVSDPARHTAIERFRGDVEFDRVSFAYNRRSEGSGPPPDDDWNWVLRDISLKIPAGESLALVGATGAGKSSIIGLIARFYDVQRGAVLVDGRNVRDYAQAALRRRIGIVLQDPFIFFGTIAENISLRNPAVTRERVIEAARFVNAHGWISARPGGYDEVMRERGASLSTGQKQLLAFARAIAQGHDILLILDEATASVDTETEVLIQDALKRIMKGRTCIIIAHRLSTIRDVSRIVVMRHGAIVEQGSHAELLRLDGYYRRLYELLAHTPAPSHTPSPPSS